MLKSTSLFLGLRYIHAKRRHQFISFISGFSLLGMALGTLALIVVLSVMNGFDREIKQRILSVVPHAFIDKPPRLKEWQTLTQHIADTPHLVASAPYIGGYAMLSSRHNVQGVELQAIMPDDERKVSIIDNYVTAGSMDALQPGQFGIVLGRLLARALNLNVGDKVLMTLPEVIITPAGIFPRVKRFTVVATFEVGAQVDQSLAMIHLADAQKLFRYGSAVQGLRLKADNIYAAQALVAELKQKLGSDYALKDWSQTQGSLFQAIKLEKRIVTLLLLIIIAVAALNIVTGLVLMVADKRGDIAVLRTLGMTTRQIMAVFIIQGSVVGIIGVVTGAVLGCLLAANMSAVITFIEGALVIQIFDPTVYFISRVPSELRLGDVALICVSGLAMSILATFYPAYQASKIQPAEVLRYH